MQKAIRARERRLTAAGLAWIGVASVAGAAIGSLAAPWLIASVPTEPPWLFPASVAGGLALGLLAGLLVPLAIRASHSARTKPEFPEHDA